MKVVEKKNIVDKILDEKMRYLNDERSIDYILLTEGEAVQLYDKLREDAWWYLIECPKKKAEKIHDSVFHGIPLKVEGL